MFRFALLAALLTACSDGPDVRQPAMTTAPAPASDPHSYARPRQARVTHIALDWSVDFASKSLVGQATLTLERTPAARELFLDGRDLVIEAIEDEHGTALAFRVDRPEPVLGDRMRVELGEGTRAVRVRYRTAPGASGLQWLEPAQTAGGKAPYLFSQAQAINARSFIPCQDSPGLRVTYEASVRVPEGMTALMSAGSRARADDGAFRFAMELPIPPYLIAIAVGQLEFRQIGPRTGVWSEPEVVARAAGEFADLERMLEAIEAMFGAYRWGRYDVLVLPPSFPFGGMENPLMTFATPTLLAGDRSLVNVIAHELAHSWSGNLVTNATWSDFWLNEGFTVYLERRILERLYGEQLSVQDAILGRSELIDEIAEFESKPGDTRLHIDLAGRDPDDGMTSVPYEKGALLLLMLERALGRDRFDAFLRSWFDEHAFEPVTTAQFERVLRERLLEGDSDLARRLCIEEWLYGEGLPANVPVLDASVFEAPNLAAAAFLARTRSAGELGSGDWTTNEWLHFLGLLPKDLAAERLAELDGAWNLTERGNAEIAAAWLECAVRAGYEPAYPRLESFLISIGRRKYLKPLFTALARTPEGKQRAMEIYSKSRAGYHPIAQGTIDEILFGAGR